MKFISLAKKNLKRLKTLDAALIAFYDLLCIGLFAVLGLLGMNLLLKSVSFLSKVILNNQLMLTNPSVTEFNLSMFRQASGVIIWGFIAMGLGFSFFYTLLNYLQWSRVSGQNLSKRKAIQYVGFQSLFILGFLIAILISYYFLLDTTRVVYSLPIYLAIITHLLMGGSQALLAVSLKEHHLCVASTITQTRPL